MNRQMTTYSPPQMPAPMGRDLSNTVAKFKNRLEEHPGPYRHFSISEQLAPTGAERQALQARRNELMDALAPGNPQDIAQEVRLLKVGFASYGVDEMSAEVQVGIFVEALAQFPLWAVREARARFRDGKNVTPWNPRECPTSAQVAAECRAIISPVQDELRPIADVLDAEIAPAPDPDMQKRLSAVMRWEQEIRPAIKNEGKPQNVKQDAEKKLGEHYQKRNEPVVIGAELAKKLAEIHADIEAESRKEALKKGAAA